MLRKILPLLLLSLIAFGCVINFDEKAAVEPKPIRPQTPETITPTDETPAVPAENIQNIPPAQAMDLSEFASLHNSFAFDLYNKAVQNNMDDNVFFSPYSIYTALGMAYAGAKKDTQEQMLKALHFNPDTMSQHASFKEMSDVLNDIGKRGNAQFSIANGLFQSSFYENYLQADYQDILKKYYDSELHSLDFQNAKESADFINDWVLERTNKRIKDMVSENNIRDSNDGMVLINAIFFKGNWRKQFNPKNTQIQDFYYKPEKAIPVNMMNAKDYYAYAEIEDMQVIELPYDEKELSMLVFLPFDKGGKVPTLTAEIYEKALHSLKNQEVMLWLPSFTLDLNLAFIPNMLKEMGMKDAFSEIYADFTGIRDPKAGADLFIKDILHKAFVEVNEEGTEAAAATAIIMATKSMATPEESPIYFRADHPFIYMIIHKPSQNILFLGKLTEPNKADK